MKDLNTKDMILISLFAALTAVGAFIKIPFPPVPFTLQFLFCAYSGVLLGSKRGLISQLLYVGIGLIGIPVFAKGGGITYIFQPTFGYLLGFILCSYIIGKMTENKENQNIIARYFAIVTGLGVVYLFGVTYLYFMWNLLNASTIGWQTALAWGFTPYILPDLALSFVVTATSYKIIRVLTKSGISVA